MSDKSKFEADLANMKKAWKSSEKEYDHTFGGESVPDAIYFIRVQDLKLSKTKAKKLYVAREWIIVKGEHKGVPVRDMLHLSTDKGFVFLRQFIMMMGHKCPTDPTKIEKVLVEIKKEARTVKASVSHSQTPTGSFTNVRVNQLISKGESSMSKDYDLDDLDMKGLKKLIKKEDLDVDPDDYDDEDDLREAVEEELKSASDDNDNDNDDDDVDLDEMDEDELRDYIESKDIDIDDLGFDSKKEYKKASEKKIRKALSAYLEENAGGSNDDDDEKPSSKGKKGKGKGKGKKKEDDLLERAKTFCDAWDIKIDEDEENLKKVKKAIATEDGEDAEYPEDELDEDEIALLEELGLEDTIKRAKKKGKKGGKKGK